MCMFCGRFEFAPKFQVQRNAHRTSIPRVNKKEKENLPPLTQLRELNVLKVDCNIKVLAVVQRTGAIFNSWYVATKFLQASQSTRNSNSILHKDEEKMRIEMPPKPETVMDLQKGPYTSHKMCSVVSQNWDSTEVRSLPILFSAKDSCNIWSGIVLLAESFASQLQYLHT